MRTTSTNQYTHLFSKCAIMATPLTYHPLPMRSPKLSCLRRNSALAAPALNSNISSY